MRVNLTECVKEYEDLLDEYKILLRKYNKVIDDINDKGGEEFLSKAVIPKEQNVELSRDDLTDIIMLCHPDKHSGSDRSVRVSRKIILLRKY